MIAIDLGSNTIRFIEFDGEKWGNDFEKIVKTAESLHQTRRITDNALERIVDAIAEAKTKLDFFLHDVVGYTTAAMRLASNAAEMLEDIEARTGIRFSVIDAQKEAELTLRAVRYRLKKLGNQPSSFLLADIGGGSTELIAFNNGAAHSVSLNTGIVTLSESADSLDNLGKIVERFTNDVRTEVSTLGSAETLVLTAGTPTTIAAYLLGMDYTSYDPHRVNGFVLRLDECLRVYEEILKMDESERARYVGVGRESLIAAGILMVISIYRALECETAIVVDDGLREGIALEYFGY